jgi:hypothetical protein
LKFDSGLSLIATLEGEFSMSCGPYASKGARAALDDKGLAVRACSVDVGHLMGNNKRSFISTALCTCSRPSRRLAAYGHRAHRDR